MLPKFPSAEENWFGLWLCVIVFQIIKKLCLRALLFLFYQLYLLFFIFLIFVFIFINVCDGQFPSLKRQNSRSNIFFIFLCDGFQYLVSNVFKISILILRQRGVEKVRYELRALQGLVLEFTVRLYWLIIYDTGREFKHFVLLCLCCQVKLVLLTQLP